MAETDGWQPSCKRQEIKISYHKDFGHMTENCLTLKTFLGHLAKYVKTATNEKKVAGNADDSDEGPVKRPASKIVVGVIEAIHSSFN